MSIFYIQKYREMVYFWRLWSTFAYTSWLWSIISPERNIHFWSNKKYLKEKTLHIFMIALSPFHWGSNNSPFSDPRPPLNPELQAYHLWHWLTSVHMYVAKPAIAVTILESSNQIILIILLVNNTLHSISLGLGKNMQFKKV